MEARMKVWDKLDYLNLYGIDLDAATITYAAEIDGNFSILIRIRTEIIKKYWEEVLEKDLDKITLVLCSPGGDASAIFAIADMYDFYKKEGILFDIFVEGICFSAATFVIGLASGVRRATKRTRFMIHELQISNVEGTATQTKATQKEIDFIQEEALKIYSELYTKKNFPKGVNKKQIKEIEQKIDIAIRNETYLSAQEALEYGLIDEVV